MKLYVTYTSPYARLARIVVIEKAIEDRVEIIEAKTRTLDSPYYQINPSGRVPYLVDDAGLGIEDSQLICAYLDSLDVSRASTVREGNMIGLTFGSSSWRAACATASRYGRARCIAPRASVRPPHSPMRWPAASAWQMFLRAM
jgi:glutathione S-transferase